MAERCETCGDPATQWDYDQFMYFCDRHVQQADFTVPLEDKTTMQGCPKHPIFDRACRDFRCQKHWSPDGAPSPDEQLARWVAGDSVCPNSKHECCPDFSCCRPALRWPEEKRRKFASADQRTREKMCMGALGAAVSLAFSDRTDPPRVHITRGEPTDYE